MSWSLLKLEEIASVKRGRFLPKGHDYSSVPTSHAYIRARDIGNNRITFSKPVYIEDRTYRQISNYIVNEGNIAVTIIGANIGDVGYISAEFDGANLTGNAAKLVVNERLCDSKFLSFQLATSRTKERFQLLSGGSAQSTLGLHNIKSLEVVIPPLVVQKKIASILSTYDNLIENNRRRIQLLEQAARLLHKEWFVHFRFPGHEHVKIKDGAPEGWERRPIGDVAPFQYGKALKKDNRVPGPFPVYGSSGIVGNHESALVKGPAIIVGRKGNFGSVFWSEADFYPIDTVYFIDSKQCSIYLYYALLETQFINTDVAVPGLNRDSAHSRKILVPERKILLQFEQDIGFLRTQIYTLTRYNEKLTQARNLLLPRLMNGEIAV